MRTASFRLILSGLCLGCLSFGAGVAGAAAQTETSQNPPKVLMIAREFLKSGKQGPAHVKTEQMWVKAATAAHSDQYYYGMDSISGEPRSLFFYRYASFDAMEQDHKKVHSTTTLQAAFDRAEEADGELRTRSDESIWVRADELSNVHNNGVRGAHYIQITSFIIKPGHSNEFEELAKQYVAAYKQGAPEVTWACYRMVFGRADSGGDQYIVITPMKAMAEVDRSFGEDEAAFKGMGEAGQKRAAQLSSDSILLEQTNLFAINPEESYVPKNWIDSDPEFWKTKAIASTKTEARKNAGQ